MTNLPRKKNKKRSVRRSANTKPSKLGTTSTYRPTKKVKTERKKRDLQRRWSLRLEGLLVVLLAGFVGYRLLVLRDSVLLEYDIAAPQTLQNLDELSRRIGSGIDTELSAEPLGRVKPFLPREEINTFLGSVPEIDDWSISTTALSSKLSLTVDFAEPVALYSVGSQEFFVAGNGRLVGPRDSQIHSVYDTARLLQIEDTQALLQPQVGDRVLSGSDTLALVSIADALANQGRGVQSVRLTDAPREAEIVLQGSGGLFARVFLDGDPVGQAASMLEGLEYLESNDITPEEYIDVRLVERFVYR